MFTRSISVPVMMSLTWISFAATAFCAIPITVTDKKGRTIEIELISVSDESVTFNRKGDLKEFTLPLANFEENSQGLIRKQASLIPAAAPKLDAAVSIGKRRDKYNYYMTNQTLSCTIKFSNLDAKAAVPPLSGKIVFFGQNRRKPSVLNVLSSQTFEVALERAGSATREMKPFKTAYDSDNKGTGNIGGFEYFGYILALKDKEGKVIFDQSSGGKLGQSLKEKRHLLEDILDFAVGKQITDKMEPTEVTLSTYRSP